MKDIDATEIIQVLCGRRRGIQYSENIRKFALSLHYNSPKAYRYVRAKFNNTLPNESTIKKWYANSSVDGEPGISRGAIRTLKKLVEEARSAGSEFYCSLVFDEMAIRQHVQYNMNEKKNSGFITFGHKNDAPPPVASQSITFMINGLNKPCSFPVAHEFVTVLNAEQKSKLLDNVVSEITFTGAKIVAISYDGLPANFKACEILGALFDPKNLRPYILNSVDHSKIRVVFDACHMLKLIRNFMESKKYIYDEQKRKIEWDHFVKLVSLRIKSEFCTHKISRKNVELKGVDKMSVKLAAQLFSASVANSLEFVMNQNYAGFDNCSGTIEFCRKINNIFDVMNTGPKDSMENSNANIFKVPLCSETARCVFDFLDDAYKYIELLTHNNMSIL